MKGNYLKRLIETRPFADLEDLRDIVSVCALFCWITLNTPIAMLCSRSAYLHMGIIALAFLASMAMISLWPTLQRFLKKRLVVIGLGTAVFACGVAFSLDLEGSVLIACIVAQYALCAPLLWTCADKISENRPQMILCACCLGPVATACVQGAVQLTAYALDVTANVDTYASLAIGIISAMPLICTIFMRGNRERQIPRQDISSETCDDGGISEMTVSVTSSIALCAGLFACALFSGATLNPHLYDYESIITAGAVIASLPAILGFAVFCVSAPGKYAVKHSWALACSLALGIGALATFAFGNAAGAEIGITLIFSAQIDLMAMLFANACLPKRNTRFASLRLFALLIGGGWPHAYALGINMKQEMGYSVAALTPFVIAAVTALAVLYLFQNALQANKARIAFAGAANSDATAKPQEAAPTQAEEIPARTDQKSSDAIAKSSTSIPIDSISDQLDSLRYEALGLFGLTAREREVAVLALRGLTYSRIAAELQIANKTVGYHLSNAYRKANVGSKSDLALAVDEIIRNDIYSSSSASRLEQQADRIEL